MDAISDKIDPEEKNNNIINNGNNIDNININNQISSVSRRKSSKFTESKMSRKLFINLLIFYKINFFNIIKLILKRLY